MWICLALASVGTATIARECLRAAFPIIETPGPEAAVPAKLRVRGYLGPASTRGPLWLVARSGHEDGCRRSLLRTRVTPNPDGAFTATLTVRGARGTRYWLQLVAANQHANDLFNRSEYSSMVAVYEWKEQGDGGCRHIPELEGGGLPAGATPLASVIVTLAEDSP